ncbi:MAG: aminotransferase class V-fold PLP-dependent enzyme [Trueperaceae bacterium]|nr:aminotransferase class V-fold PLP-dependent enzyme [Trueperaceae bacterium]
MSSYESLGIRPVINAFATLTKLGGSVMPAEVVQAMVDASKCFVDLHDLQRKVGERIAELTHNEAAYVSSGAAAGLLLATAACVAGKNPDLIERFPNLSGLKNAVIVQRLHRNGYDYAVRETGVKLVEIGSEDGTSEDDLRQALNENTAAIFWFQGAMNRPSELALDRVITIANEHGVPVIVDAAAQLPPVENLWKFTQMGAALAVFSGGKDLSGPQSSGLVLGRKDLIEAIRMHGAPNHAVGRPMKVGKEEMMGLLAAVERYLTLDHKARGVDFEARVKLWNEGLKNIEGVTASRDYPNEAGQPAPRTLLSFSEKYSKDEIIQKLWDGDPCIAVAPANGNGILLNPMTLDDVEAEIVLQRLKEVMV